MQIILHPKDLFRIDKFLLESSVNIIFICGKDLNDNTSARRTFLNHAKKHFSTFLYLIAEDVFSADSKNNNDLLTTESNMTNYADCIVVILESESAFAELGAFAHSNDIAKKMLIINDKKFINSKSFINLGPVQKVNKVSFFGKTIYTDLRAITLVANEIQKRIAKLPHKRASSVIFKDFADMGTKYKARLLLLAELISLFSPITKKEIIEYLKTYYDEWFDFLNNDLAILESLNFIEKKTLNKIDFLLGKSIDRKFLKIPFHTRANIRSNVIIRYRKKSPERLVLLTRKSQNVT